MGSPDDAGSIETGEFDWNSVKDGKNIELWLVRVPNSVCSFFNLFPLLPSFSAGLTTGSGPVLRPFRGFPAVEQEP
jgi:hypothetical protein